MGQLVESEERIVGRPIIIHHFIINIQKQCVNLIGLGCQSTPERHTGLQIGILIGAFGIFMAMVLSWVRAEIVISIERVSQLIALRMAAI